MERRRILIRVRRWHFVLGVALAAGLILWRAVHTLRNGVVLAPPGKAIHAPVGELREPFKK